MKSSRFALTECCGLAVDLIITGLLFLSTTYDPLMARLPGALAGLAVSCSLNNPVSFSPTNISRFLKNAITILSRIVGVGLFTLLLVRNPLLQPIIPLVFSAAAALALALIGYVRLSKRNGLRS